MATPNGFDWYKCIFCQRHIPKRKTNCLTFCASRSREAQNVRWQLAKPYEPSNAHISELRISWAICLKLRNVALTKKCIYTSQTQWWQWAWP